VRYDKDHDSPDVVDRRGQTYRGGGGGGGGGLLRLLLPLVASRFGLGGVAVLLVGYVGLQLLAGGGGPSADVGAGGRTAAPGGPPDPQKAFVGFVLDDVQATWAARYPGPGAYRRAKLVLFTGRTPTACGLGESATGPFYCPGDEHAYIDLAFFEALARRLGAPGDFAQAYVLAHEIGHHVQKLTGASARVHRAPKAQQQGAEGLSVRLELQADCYAGVWAHATKQRGLIEAGDLEEALTAASAIGDDTLQRNATGTVRPESFSHGTSAQRARWFRRGFEGGDPAACDTFGGAL
jgi:predicted metalloprotease